MLASYCHNLKNLAFAIEPTAIQSDQPRKAAIECDTGASDDVLIPENTVKTRLFYAREKLAELLKAAGVE
jgi:hypothetical protein